MGTPFVDEIRMFAGNFAPAGWAFCQGLCRRGDAALLCRVGGGLHGPVTPAGTYQLTATAASTTVQASAPVTLNVK